VGPPLSLCPHNFGVLMASKEIVPQFSLKLLNHKI
jgi:hypothetical protein